jgi:hypothetical protein
MCELCRDTGIWDTGNNELPCPNCPELADRALFYDAHVIGGPVTGREVKRHFLNSSPEPLWHKAPLHVSEIPGREPPAKEEVFQAMRGLIEFADHKDRCRVWRKDDSPSDPRACNCGYQQALRAYYHAAATYLIEMDRDKRLPMTREERSSLIRADFPEEPMPEPERPTVEERPADTPEEGGPA